MKVNTFCLVVPFGYQSCFVSVNSPICFKFNFIDPFATYWSLTSRKICNLLDLILLQGCDSVAIASTQAASFFASE